MTEQEFNEEANKWADDMVWALVDMKRKANDDEVDFLVQEYKDLQKYFTKELQEEIELLKKSDSLCKIIGEQKLKIADLEEQIEKMKCCGNCKYKDCNKTSQYQKCWYCKNKNKWELAEN